MSLARIREKNKKKNKNSFINSRIEYDELSPEYVEYVKEKIFKEIVEPNNERMLEKLYNE